MVGIKKSSRVKFTSMVVLCFAISLWSGCGGGMNVGTSAATSNGVKITPSGSTLRAGDKMHFSATVTGNTDQTVIWSVNGVASGNTTVGTIDSKGMYHSPASVPQPNSVKVQAVSVADKTLSASSPVTLQNPIPVPQSVNPTFLTVGSFTVTVSGKGFASGAKVIFGGAELATTVVSPTQLTATGTSTQAQEGTVKIAVENPDPGKITSSASLNVQVGAAGQVSVTVIPATAQLHAGDTFA